MFDISFHENYKRLIETRHRSIINIKILFKIRDRFQLCYRKNGIYFSIIRNIEMIC